MGQIISKEDWTGRLINGCILGLPTREFTGDDKNPPSGNYIWDGPYIPTGECNPDGDIVIKDDTNKDVKVASVGKLVALKDSTTVLTKAEELEGKTEVVKEGSEPIIKVVIK